MTHPALHDMDYDQLTRLIDEATNLRTTKFEGREQDNKKDMLNTELSEEQAFSNDNISVLGER